MQSLTVVPGAIVLGTIELDLTLMECLWHTQVAFTPTIRHVFVESAARMTGWMRYLYLDLRGLVSPVFCASHKPPRVFLCKVFGMKLVGGFLSPLLTPLFVRKGAAFRFVNCL